MRVRVRAGALTAPCIRVGDHENVWSDFGTKIIRLHHDLLRICIINHPQRDGVMVRARFKVAVPFLSKHAVQRTVWISGSSLVLVVWVLVVRVRVRVLV